MQALDYLKVVKTSGGGRTPADDVARIVAAVLETPGKPFVESCKPGERLIESTGEVKPYTAKERALSLAGSVRRQLAKSYKAGTFVAVAKGEEVHALIDGPWTPEPVEPEPTDE